MCAAEACCCKQEKLRRRWTLDAAQHPAKKETVGGKSRLGTAEQIERETERFVSSKERERDR